MIADVKIFFIFLLMIVCLYKCEESHQVNKLIDDSSLMFDVLLSLLRLNEARYETIKKLNYLNNVNYLRTQTENAFDFEKLLNKLKSIFKFLSVKPSEKKSEDNVDNYDIFYNNNYILTIPNINYKNVLRTWSKESDSDENNDSFKNKISSDEKNDNIVNNKSTRFLPYSCSRGELRCYLACKEASYISLSARQYIYDLYKQLKSSCRDEFFEMFINNFIIFNIVFFTILGFSKVELNDLKRNDLNILENVIREINKENKIRQYMNKRVNLINSIERNSNYNDNDDLETPSVLPFLKYYLFQINDILRRNKKKILRGKSSESSKSSNIEHENGENMTFPHINTEEIVNASDGNDTITIQKLNHMKEEKAEIKCLDACQEAYRSVCRSHNCNYRMRQKFKKSCVTACGNRF